MHVHEDKVIFDEAEQDMIISEMEISCLYSDIYFTLFLTSIGTLFVGYFTVAFIYAALQGAFSVFLFQAEPLSMASRGQFVSFHGSFFVTLLCVLSILMTLSNLPSISMLYDKLYHAYSLLETPKPMYRLLSHDHLVIRAQSRLGQILRQLHATSSWLSFLANAVPIAAVYFFSPSALACSTCPSIVQKWAFYCCSALPLGYWISVWYGGRLMSQAAQEVSDLKKSKYKLKGA